MRYTSDCPAILIIIGPSGSGKSTAIRSLLKRQLVEVVPTWTTRHPRPEEVGSLEHIFVTDREFHSAADSRLLLETKQMFNLPYWYGLPVINQPAKGRVALVVLRAPLIELFAKHYHDFIIYQIEDSLPRIKQRLLSRKRTGEDMGSRLASAKEEISLGRKLAKRIFVNNDSPEVLSDKLEAAILEDFKLSR